jgi:hypothetical protein
MARRHRERRFCIAYRSTTGAGSHGISMAIRIEEMPRSEEEVKISAVRKSDLNHLHRERAVMRLFAVALAGMLLVAQTAAASCYRSDEGRLATHNCYESRSGDYVHSPSRTYNRAAPVGYSAQCRDGTWSFSEHHRGTCSHHGGVAR